MPEVDVTEDQANEALHQLMGGDDAESGVPQAAEVAPEQPAEVAAPVETEAATEEAVEVPEGTPAEPESDDVASLKARTEELEAAKTDLEKRFEERMRAQQDRFASNEQILRDRYLRKSTVADKALKVLRATRSESGVSEAEVDAAIREMEGTMNPASASYTPPETSAAATEDQELIYNSFLNEQGMTRGEADEFAKWIRTDAESAMSPMEQAVARESLNGFLRLAHGRWQQGIQEKEKEAKRSDAVGAVQSVKRTQREAARAASPSTTAPQKQPAGPGRNRTCRNSAATTFPPFSASRSSGTAEE